MTLKITLSRPIKIQNPFELTAEEKAMLHELDRKKQWAAKRARDRAWPGRIAKAGIHDHPLNAEEMTAAMSQPSGPPPFPQTADNWRLTPLSDEQFAFIYTSILSQREAKATLINERADGFEEIPVEQIPVLTWASPKEFERLLYYAKKTKDERDEARLIAGALHALAVNRAGQTKVNQVMQDALLLNERLAGTDAVSFSPTRYPPPESQGNA